MSMVDIEGSEEMKRAVAIFRAHRVHFQQIAPFLDSVVQAPTSQAIKEFAEQFRRVQQSLGALAIDRELRKTLARVPWLQALIHLNIDLGIFSSLSESIRALAEPIRKKIPIWERVAVVEEAFRAVDWPIVPSMSQTLVDRVVQYYQEGRSRDVSRIIIAHFHKNNPHNFDKWWRNGGRIHCLHPGCIFSETHWELIVRGNIRFPCRRFFHR